MGCACFLKSVFLLLYRYPQSTRFDVALNIDAIKTQASVDYIRALDNVYYEIRKIQSSSGYLFVMMGDVFSEFGTSITSAVSALAR
jgi:hypothetical protein